MLTMHKPPRLSRTNTRVNRRNVGGAPAAQPGVPSSTSVVWGASWESPATLGSSRPWCPHAQLRSVDVSWPPWHPQSAGRGDQPPWTCLCMVPVPASPSLAGVMACHGRDGQGPVHRGLTQQDEQWWWDHPGAEQDKHQHRGSLGQWGQAARGGQAQPLGISPSPCSHTPPRNNNPNPPHTHGRYAEPPCSLDPSQKQSSGVKITQGNSFSIICGRRRYEGSARMDQPPTSPLPPQPCWVAQTCSRMAEPLQCRGLVSPISTTAHLLPGFFWD